jgi:hypothetical protein
MIRMDPHSPHADHVGGILLIRADHAHPEAILDRPENTLRVVLNDRSPVLVGQTRFGFEKTAERVGGLTKSL